MVADMNLGTLFAEFPARYHGCGPATTITGLAVDSRTVGPGLAFVAIAGATHDGHDFLAAAIAAGAAILVVQAGRAALPDHPHVVLPDTAAALPRLAARMFGEPARGLRLAGVTGTNGKTTVSHLVAAMLKAAGRPHVRLGTTGNWLVDHEAPAQFTTPFPLELQALLATARERGATDLIMEVSSHALVQGRARPLVFQAVGMTSFSQDHLDLHGTMAAYLEAKCRLASEHLARDGVAVAAVDGQPAADEFLATARATGAQVWRASRGSDPQAELHVQQNRSSAAGLDLTIATPHGLCELRSPLIGGYNIDNVLVAVGLGLGLGLALPAVQAGLAGCTGAPGRLERVLAAQGPAVYVDYAHTPDAVARVLGVVREVCRGQLWVVLGCGGDRDPSKRAVMGAVAAAGADHFVATSDNPRSEAPEEILAQMLAGVTGDNHQRVTVIVDRARAISWAIASAAATDIVVIAGKGHETYQIVGDHRLDFDDREHAAAALAQWTG